MNAEDDDLARAVSLSLKVRFHHHSSCVPELVVHKCFLMKMYLLTDCRTRKISSGRQGLFSPPGSGRQ